MNAKIAAIIAIVVIVAAGAGGAVVLTQNHGNSNNGNGGSGDTPSTDTNKGGWYAWDPTVVITKTAYYGQSPMLYKGAAEMFKTIYGKDVNTSQYTSSQVPADFLTYDSLIVAEDNVNNTVTIDSIIRDAKDSNGNYTWHHENTVVPVNPDWMICTGSYVALLYELIKIHNSGTADQSAVFNYVYGLDKSALAGGSSDINEIYGLTVPNTVVSINSTYSLNKQANLAQYLQAYDAAHAQNKKIVTMMSGSTGDTYTDMIGENGFLKKSSEYSEVTNLFFGATSVAEVFSSIEALGAVFGLKDEAQTFIQETRTNFYNMYMQAKEVTPQKTVYWESRNNASACGQNNISSTILDLLNLKNIVTGEGWVKGFGDENVVLKEPSVIIFYTGDSRTMDQMMRVATA